MTAGPYARIYQTIWTDPRFAAIIADDALLGAWTRLLLLAEAAWPQSVALPRCIPAASLAVLVEAGVIELHPADTYRVHGLDPERQERSEHGIEANRRRWHPDTPSNPPGTPPSIPARTPHALLAPRSRPLSSTSPENVERAVPSDPLLEALMSVNGVPSKRAMDWVAEMAAEFGEDATIRALGTAALEGPVKVLSRAQSALKASVIRRDRADAKRKEAELSQARSDRMASRRADPGPADPRPLGEILKEMQP